MLGLTFRSCAVAGTGFGVLCSAAFHLGFQGLRSVIGAFVCFICI